MLQKKDGRYEVYGRYRIGANYAVFTQSDQTLSAAGKVYVVGTATVTQADQTTATVGKVAIVGTASVTQAANTTTTVGRAYVVGVTKTHYITFYRANATQDNISIDGGLLKFVKSNNNRDDIAVH